jgi:hypothetical protein
MLSDFSSECSFTCHGTSVFKVISERPVILPSECRALGEGTSLPILNVLDLTRPARAELELTTYRLLSDSTTTRLRGGSILTRILTGQIL